MSATQDATRGSGAHQDRIDALVLPIGRFVGSSGGDDPPDGRRHRLCVDGQLVDLTDGGLAVWALAHGSLDPITAGGTPWTMAELEGYAGRAGIADTGRLIAELTERGLLVEAPPEGPAARVFAERHRIVPTMIGLGNTAEEPEVFSIGTFDREVARVDEALYDLWTWSGPDDSLWRVCATLARLAATVADPGGPEPDPAELLAAFLRQVHQLLTSGILHFDRAAA